MLPSVGGDAGPRLPQPAVHVSQRVRLCFFLNSLYCVMQMLVFLQREGLYERFYSRALGYVFWPTVGTCSRGVSHRYRSHTVDAALAVVPKRDDVVQLGCFRASTCEVRKQEAVSMLSLGRILSLPALFHHQHWLRQVRQRRGTAQASSARQPT